MVPARILPPNLLGVLFAGALLLPVASYDPAWDYDDPYGNSYRNLRSNGLVTNGGYSNDAPWLSRRQLTETEVVMQNMHERLTGVLGYDSQALNEMLSDDNDPVWRVHTLRQLLHDQCDCHLVGECKDLSGRSLCVQQQAECEQQDVGNFDQVGPAHYRCSVEKLVTGVSNLDACNKHCFKYAYFSYACVNGDCGCCTKIDPLIRGNPKSHFRTFIVDGSGEFNEIHDANCDPADPATHTYVTDRGMNYASCNNHCVDNYKFFTVDVSDSICRCCNKMHHSSEDCTGRSYQTKHVCPNGHEDCPGHELCVEGECKDLPPAGVLQPCRSEENCQSHNCVAGKCRCLHDVDCFAAGETCFQEGTNMGSCRPANETMSVRTMFTVTDISSQSTRRLTDDTSSSQRPPGASVTWTKRKLSRATLPKRRLDHVAEPPSESPETSSGDTEVFSCTGASDCPRQACNKGSSTCVDDLFVGLANMLYLDICKQGRSSIFGCSILTACDRDITPTNTLYDCNTKVYIATEVNKDVRESILDWPTANNSTDFISMLSSKSDEYLRDDDIKVGFHPNATAELGDR